ncbi:hypothetical protein QR680_019298 [Steinernema hermaphroditum]|uniref:Uncharacterized protein n=1 Tax=Steinernema hermaphroditum TaxID=289476 RepID=A0AA39GNN3_9BILA|nr:hypothetical protein QR680_019298 [Steinernema hermaphroditum]
MVGLGRNVVVKTLVALIVFSCSAGALAPRGTNIQWWNFRPNQTKITSNKGEIYFFTCKEAFKELETAKHVVSKDRNYKADCGYRNPMNTGAYQKSATVQRAVHRVSGNRSVFFSFIAPTVHYTFFDIQKLLDGEGKIGEDEIISRGSFQLDCSFEKRHYFHERIKTADPNKNKTREFIMFADGYFDPTGEGSFSRLTDSKCNDDKPIIIDNFKDNRPKYKLKKYYGKEYQIYMVENDQFIFTVDTQYGLGENTARQQKLYFHTVRTDWGSTPNIGSVKLVHRGDIDDLIVPLFYYKDHQHIHLEPADPCEIRHPIKKVGPFAGLCVVAFIMTNIVLVVVAFLCLRVIPKAKARIRKRGDSAVTIGAVTMEAAMGDEFSAMDDDEEDLQKTQSVSFSDDKKSSKKSKKSSKKLKSAKRNKGGEHSKKSTKSKKKPADKKSQSAKKSKDKKNEGLNKDY